MNTSVLTPDKDPMGAAIADYYNNGKASKLRVFSSQFDEDEIPVGQLFRSFDEMPKLEQEALRLSKGKILDVGAGAGCHSLVLEKKGKDVTAVDVSPLSVDVMKHRGLHKAFCTNIFDERFSGSFDTILFLMNGSGIIGKIERLPAFFARMKQLLAKGGQILMDSSDLKYLYEEEDGSYLIDIAGDYYGEADFKMKYKNVSGDAFDWLYIDFDTLSLYAEQNGFKAELIDNGEHYDYLVRLTMD
jgi:SAM-dependent methyltransferase